MNWSNVLLIFRREVRDQLRDRRTLFTVLVLPLLLYPLLGAIFLQVGQFLRDHPTRTLIIGAEHLPEDPPLLVDGEFASEVSSDDDGGPLELTISAQREGQSFDDIRQQARRDLQSGKFDAVVYFPRDFADKLAGFRAGLSRTPANQTAPAVAANKIPQPVVFKNTAVDKSRIASLRIDDILSRWRELIVQENLEQSRVPPAATKPFRVDQEDLAEPVRRQAAAWSKILPFVLLVWALTGAFYPAIDLCAGEKERGTLETLLCSPALRSEIVWGKLLTVMTFSMATSLLNLASMGFTWTFAARQIQSASPDILFGGPPLAAIFWLLLALPPMSALFSALALAIASFARSSKEGQYYLMPLLMVMLPMMTLPMLPATNLDLGVSLIPVTGLMLLLRNLMEGQVSESIRYAVPVVLVTAVCCLMAIRWAIDQFNRESVLFRESEQLGISSWIKHLVRDRGDTPNFTEAMLCAVVLLVIKFFAGFIAGIPSSFGELRTLLLVTQLAFIAATPLLMAVILTRRPMKTLLLTRPSFLGTVPAAMLLAAMLHPSMMVVSDIVRQLYPISEETLRNLQPLTSLFSDAPLWEMILLVGVVPAICEELAFRGFILSGFRHIGHKWTAIVLTAAFFGAVHGILQQSIGAFVVGIVLGYITVKTGSLLPAIGYHFTHNTLTLVSQHVSDQAIHDRWWLWLIFERSADGTEWSYTSWATLVSALCGAAILLWFKSLPYEATREEVLEATRDHQPRSSLSKWLRGIGGRVGAP